MKIEIDTHTHTLASGHAYNTIKEMAAAASDKGLKGLAVTDHAVQMPGTCHIYYFQNLRVVPRQMHGIELLMGTELNILNEKGEVDLSQELLKELDIAIASMHFPCYKGECTREMVTRAYVNVMQNPYVDIIGHPDDGRFPVDMEILVREAKKTGTLLEVNNSSLHPLSSRQGARENIRRMLEACLRHRASVILGTDSHICQSVGDFTQADALLREVDFPRELIINTDPARIGEVVNIL